MRLSIALSITLSCLLCSTAGAVPIVGVAPHSGLTFKDSSEKAMPGGPPTQVLTTGGITFNIYYMDVINNNGIGFDGSNATAARARVDDTLTYLAGVLHETGTLDFVVRPSILTGTSFLASAGTFFPVAAGSFPGSAQARLHDPENDKPFANSEEMYMTVDFSFPWNFTTSPAPNNTFDFQTVLLHEFTHSLGFASLAEPDGSSEITNNCYTVYDGLLRRRTGNVVLFGGNPPSFHGVVSDFVSGNLAWGGDEAIQAYQPNPAPGLYAPNPFEPGSSVSHWNTNNIIGGAVMEHAITDGETRRTYAPIDLGALRDMGYLDASDENCSFSVCPDFDGQGTALYAYAAGVLSQPLDYATSDLDGSGIPDRFEMALIERVLCVKLTEFSTKAPCVYNANMEVLSEEANFAAVQANADALTALLTISSDLQGALAALGLTGTYEALTASNTKSYGEILSPAGDPDQDGLSNLEEYQNVIGDGGDEAEFVAAVFDPLLDGTIASGENVPASGLAGLGIALSALAVAGAVMLRRKPV